MTARTAWIVAAALWAVSGCAADNDVGALYRLERSYYEARQLERKAYSTYPVDAYVDWLVARDAYEGVLLSNPANIPESIGWDPRIVATMERVALAAEIGLLRLDVVDFRFHDSVTHATYPSNPIPEVFGRVVVERVSALYDSLGESPVESRARRRLRAVVSNPTLWKGPALLRDSLLAAPYTLMQRTRESTDATEGFYSRVIASWPDSAVAARARDYRSRVLMARGDMEAALVDVELASVTHPNAKRRVELELAQSDLLGFSLGRTTEATTILRRIIERDPEADAAWWARVRLALLDPPRDVSADDQLRRIHMDARAPYAVAAAALFARAATAEQGGDWQRASDLFSRLTQRFPDSMPALAAPLHVLRTLLARKKGREAATAFERAVEYYSLRIRDDSAALESRHLPKDCLLEACLLFNKPQEAARALESAVLGTPPDNRVATDFKVAVVECHLLRTREIVVEILQKSLELFPGSRYSMCTRWKLQRTREARDG